MKRNRILKAKAKDDSQNSYAKILSKLRSPVSEDYSKMISKEKRGVILGYD